MLILLPPSEGKAVPRRGKPLDLAALSFPELIETRTGLLTALQEMCEQEPAVAVEVLGLGPTQSDLVERNARLLTAPAARADRVYTGVLYDALDVGSLDAAARRRATRWLAVQSALFGLVRPHDHIPSYRLSGDVSLPGLGKVSARWRQALDPAMQQAAGNGLVVDLRSTSYAAFWKPAADLADQVATVRVLQQVGSQRKVVSHFNKATKGRIVRALLTDGGTPTTPADLADHLVALGWKVEAQPARGAAQVLDVVVDEV